MNVSTMSINELKRAVRIKEQIARLESELARLGGAAAKESAAPKKRKGKMSAAGRARIVAAQKARWAKIKAKTKK